MICERVGHVEGDCEDGTFLLANVLRNSGYDAWVCVDIVSMTSGMYGHAWVEALAGGHWQVLRQRTVTELQAAPPGYHISYRFTDKKLVYEDIGAMVGDTVASRMDPDPVDELRAL